MKEVAALIEKTISNFSEESVLLSVKKKVKELCNLHPLYPEIKI